MFLPIAQNHRLSSILPRFVPRRSTHRELSERQRVVINRRLHPTRSHPSLKNSRVPLFISLRHGVEIERAQDHRARMQGVHELTIRDAIRAIAQRRQIARQLAIEPL